MDPKLMISCSGPIVKLGHLSPKRNRLRGLVTKNSVKLAKILEIGCCHSFSSHPMTRLGTFEPWCREQKRAAGYFIFCIMKCFTVFSVEVLATFSPDAYTNIIVGELLMSTLSVIRRLFPGRTGPRVFGTPCIFQSWLLNRK